MTRTPKTLSRTLCPVLLLTAPFLMAATDGPGSPGYGRQITIEQCGECHRVAPDADPKPPAMAEDGAAPDLIRRMQDPAMTETALRAYLRTSHPIMPNVRLSAEQTDDIVAYLLSLKTAAHERR